MGIKELELFTIKIGYSLLVISSNYFLGLGPLRWRAGMQLRVVGVPLACRAAVLPLESCRRTCRAGDLSPGTYRRSPTGPRGLFCEAYGAGFADYGYLYLARVNHLVLNLLCYICRELLGLFV